MENKKGFTLLEIMMVIILISVGLISVVYYVQGVIKQVHTANQRIIAMNLAKEGMEMVYYARNSRVLAYSGLDSLTGKEEIAVSRRTKCRIALDQDNCTTGILGQGNYSIQEMIDNNNNPTKKINFFSQNTGINLSDGVSDSDKQYAVYLSGNVWTTASGGKLDNLTRYGRFFRQIEGLGLYKKGNTNDPLNCLQSNDCINNTPKEFHFCSVVKYTAVGNLYPEEVRLCGILTNFFPNTNQEG